MIKSLAESYQLRISSKKGPNCVCAISAIESIYHRYGLNTLDRTLRLCVASWEGEPESLTANIIKGIALLVTAFGDNLRDDLFQFLSLATEVISGPVRTNDASVYHPPPFQKQHDGFPDLLSLTDDRW